MLLSLVIDIDDQTQSEIICRNKKQNLINFLKDALELFYLMLWEQSFEMLSDTFKIFYLEQIFDIIFKNSILLNLYTIRPYGH
jgi:hypothetical protein